MKEIWKIEVNQWNTIYNEGRNRALLNEKELSLVDLTIRWLTGKLPYNLSKEQMKVVWKAKKTVEDVGIIL
jgi:hypothetical protein